MTSMKDRSSRKSLVGFVTSRSGDKTIKVECQYKIPHPRYKKEIKRKTVLVVHDANNEASVGDRVSVMETRPFSKLKRWRVVKITEKAPLLENI